MEVVGTGFDCLTVLYSVAGDVGWVLLFTYSHGSFLV